MDLLAELAHFNPDPALANWITDAVQKRFNEAQKEAAESIRLSEQHLPSAGDSPVPAAEYVAAQQ